MFQVFIKYIHSLYLSKVLVSSRCQSCSLSETGGVGLSQTDLPQTFGSQLTTCEVKKDEWEIGRNDTVAVNRSKDVDVLLFRFYPQTQ